VLAVPALDSPERAKAHCFAPCEAIAMTLILDIVAALAIFFWVLPAIGEFLEDTGEWAWYILIGIILIGIVAVTL